MAALRSEGDIEIEWSRRAASDPKATFPKSTYYFPKADIDAQQRANIF